MEVGRAEEHRSDPESAFFIAEHVMWPAARRLLLPPRALAEDHRTVQVACTEQLYKIFERC